MVIRISRNSFKTLWIATIYYGISFILFSSYTHEGNQECAVCYGSLKQNTYIRL